MTMALPLTPDDVRRALAAGAVTRFHRLAATRKAAVAAILRERQAGLEMLFIRRAEHPRDPWSGHIGWPGGRVEEHDADTLAAALRETREELGLDLAAQADCLGALSECRTHLRRKPAPRAVAPYVFALRDEVELRLNREVQEVVWVPLAVLLDRAARGTMRWTWRGVPLVMPCIRCDEHEIWGLTLHMLDEFLELLRDVNLSTP